MRILSLVLAGGFVAVLSSAAHAACSATPVSSPDGTSLSILFDDMAVDEGSAVRSCTINAPLNLPEGYSLGVYKVDYRGFAQLSKGQVATLTVDYNLGPKGNGRHFSRKVRGATADDFTFTENIGAGQMKRAGCGSAAALQVSVDLSLSGKSLTGAEATMDSSDGTAKHGLVYHFDLKKCQK
jgi:hypothetical protein